MASLNPKSTSAERPAVSPDVVTPLILDELSFKGRTLRFRQPHTIFPSFDADEGVYEAEILDFGISAWGKTLEELRYDLIDEIHFAWRVYAAENDDRLTEGAQRLKRHLLTLLEEV